MKIAFQRPSEYQYWYTDNLILQATDDSLEVRGIEPGIGRALFLSGKDTLLDLQVRILKDSLVEDAKAKIATNDPFIYLNEQLSRWIAGYAMINKPAPDFCVKSINGGKVCSQDITGKTAMLNFWYYGCSPCMKELPALQEIAEEFGNVDGVKLFSICKDSGYVKDHSACFSARMIQSENGKTVDTTVFMEFDLDINHCIKGAPLEKPFRFMGYPTTFVIDKNGVIRFVYNGMVQAERAKNDLEMLGHIIKRPG